MNFTFLNSVELCVSSHHFITTESLKSRLHMSLDQFKVSCECVFQYHSPKTRSLISAQGIMICTSGCPLFGLGQLL